VKEYVLEGTWALVTRMEPSMSLRTWENEARPTFGWDSLSDSERRVADLVARGYSNKEIAEQLYMSHRTVGSHLYRIFPKLGLRSRVQLARVVIERSLSATGGVAS
jgi:DNA-binding NarL/FixJ family response regulator